jgi:hypothetical protein
VPFAERADYLLESDIGILSQARNLETYVSARTRVLDYLWTDRPILVNEGDEWADAIRQNGFGVVIESNQVEHWAVAMVQLAQDRAAWRRMRDNMAALKHRFTWRQCVEPLYRYVLQRRHQTAPLANPMQHAA